MYKFHILGIIVKLFIEVFVEYYQVYIYVIYNIFDGARLYEYNLYNEWFIFDIGTTILDSLSVSLWYRI